VKTCTFLSQLAVSIFGLSEDVKKPSWKLNLEWKLWPALTHDVSDLRHRSSHKLMVEANKVSGCQLWSQLSTQIELHLDPTKNHSTAASPFLNIISRYTGRDCNRFVDSCWHSIWPDLYVSNTSAVTTNIFQLKMKPLQIIILTYAGVFLLFFDEPRWCKYRSALVRVLAKCMTTKFFITFCHRFHSWQVFNIGILVVNIRMLVHNPSSQPFQQYLLTFLYTPNV